MPNRKKGEWEMRNFELSLQDETFNALKSDFDMILKRTLTNMKEKEENEAEITIKLGIKLIEEIDKKDINRKIVKPMFEHKVSSILKIKDEKSGILKGDYELVWDSLLQNYVMRKIQDPQTSLFDRKDECE